MTKILLSHRVALSSHSPFCKNHFLQNHTALCGKIFCLGIVMEEFPIIWDNLQSSTCLIWNRFVNILHKPHIPNVKKRQSMVGRTIPWRHFNRPDGALFSVKAAVSKALLLKGIMANWFMSSLILPCHKWFDYIFTDIPLTVVFREV